MSQEQLEYEYFHGENEWSLYSVIHFIKNNVIQLLMLILVVIIVLVVDYIAHINASIYGLPSAIPGLPGTNSNNDANSSKHITHQTVIPTNKTAFRKHKKGRQ